MAFLDQMEISRFLAKELFYQQFLTLEGLNSGVPTRTTPTLTPTTLRNIEQTFSELQPKPEGHLNEAGFVPPLVQSIGNNQYISASDADIYSNKSQSMWHSSLSQSSSDCDTRSTPPLQKSFSNSPPQTRRNMGGRKPTKDHNISPEEEERRKIRRERNKAAAARCRKRRVDHTNCLIKETDELETKRHCLQDEISDLQHQQDELEYALNSHRLSSKCRIQNNESQSDKSYNNQYNNFRPTNQQQHDRIKTELLDTVHHQNGNDDIFILPAAQSKKLMLSSTVPISKPSRPNSLNVGATAPMTKNNIGEVAGIPISTPSTGILFNYDSMMIGGTGLTPVSGPLVPSCSSQQRNIPISIADITSPEACGPPKLVSL